MLDFSHGWTWFAAGICTTLLLLVFLLVTVAFARRSERRAPRPDPPSAGTVDERA